MRGAGYYSRPRPQPGEPGSYERFAVGVDADVSNTQLAHSSTTFLNRSKLMIPCLRCISSRGQNAHLALQMFVLSIWTISGRIGDRSRPR